MTINVRTMFTRLFSGAKTATPLENAVGFYDQLEAYYLNNGLYNELNSSAYYLNIWNENMRGLYNPASRSVEFFAPKLMPGILPASVNIITENQRIIDPIHKIWAWSNLNSVKTVAGRWLAIFGDIFIHPTSNDTSTQVYLQFLKPQNITDWTEDARGYIKSIRIDVPLANGKCHTEVWDEFQQRIWEHTMGRWASLDMLGTPMAIPISDYGIDFVPFVHVKFRDIGMNRGVGAYTLSLDKIDEANRMATRLHEILFRYNKPIWAVRANSKDGQGRPLPAPSIASASKSTSAVTGKDTTEVEDDTVMYLPGESTVEALIPDIKYADALTILQDQMKEIEKDLPELAFYRLREMGGNLSGVAVRLLLGDALDRAIEARANWEAGIIRSENMALSMGSYLGLFRNIGAYDNGDFDHSYDERDIFPESEQEKASTIKVKAEAIKMVKDAGFASVKELSQLI